MSSPRVIPDSPYDTRTTAPMVGTQAGAPGSPFAELNPPTNDPAYQPPHDPLADGKAQHRAGIIFRDIPIVTVATSWTVPMVRNALQRLVAGQFDEPAQLVDSIVGDGRVQSTLGERTGGLLGREIRFSESKHPRVRGTKAARRALAAWREVWPLTFSEPVLADLQSWAIMLGFGVSQIAWDTDDPSLWVPYLRPFHPRYTYYHWTAKRLVAMTMDGQTPIVGGDGKWLHHAPRGDYRGWMHGCVRGIAQPWIARNFAIRDQARLSERHGLPIGLSKSPVSVDPIVDDAYRSQLQNLGQESILDLPQGVEPHLSYDFKWLETNAQSYEIFRQSIMIHDMEITLCLLHHNLGTEVKEGSFAAAEIGNDVKLEVIKGDDRALCRSMQQVARPFALFNFGDADLAPSMSYDLTAYDDNAKAAKTFFDFGQALNSLRLAGHRPTELEPLAKTFGLHVGSAKFEHVQPTQVEKQAVQNDAAATGDAP